MEEYRTHYAENGRIIIPAPLRKKLGLNHGDELLLRYDNGIIKMMSMKKAVREAQDLVKMYNKDNISLTGSLKKSRLEEFDNE